MYTNIHVVVDKTTMPSWTFASKALRIGQDLTLLLPADGAGEWLNNLQGVILEALHELQPPLGMTDEAETADDPVDNDEDVEETEVMPEEDEPVSCERCGALRGHTVGCGE